MKKIMLTALFAIMAVCASAQGNLTLWWGGNFAKFTDADSEFKPLNIGLTYTAPLQDAFDYSIGASYQTKGCKDWDPGFIQLEGNGAWNFVKQDGVKVGVFTGPYVSFLVNKDDVEQTNTVDVGWQGGLKLDYSRLSLRAGYEFGFCNLFDIDKIDSRNGTFFVRVGFNF